MQWPNSLGNLLDVEARSRLRSTQTSALLAHTSIASVISTVAALVLAMYLAPTVGTAAAYTWFVLKLVVALPRFAIGQKRIRRRWESDVPKLNRVVLASLTIDGAVWGLAGVWCGSMHSEAIAGLLLGCLSSVAMLATFGLQVQQTATAAYVVPIMLPLGIALVARGDMLGFTGAGGTVLVLIQSLVTGYASERRVTREFIAQEQLRKAFDERSAALKLASETSENLQDALFEVQRQSSVKALFLGTMSHELRTPLHGILGLTDLVLKSVEGEDVRKKLNLVTSSAEHLLELIGALLEVSRIDAGKLVLHEASFDLAKELRTMAELYAIRAHSKGIGFEARLTLPNSIWVRGDAGRLRQILHNLLGNAIKFTKRGLVTLNGEERDGMFIFEIVDTGTGISADDLPHIFEAFRQTRATAPRTEDGTGLGLTIARELARAMGGDISVSSAVGVGSRFAFAASLRRVPAADVPERVQTTPLPILKQRFRVLLVEDNEVNAMIAQAHLDRCGLVTIRARDGKEAVAEAFGESRPDLILMDYRMPLMDGPAACREIRAIEEDRHQARVPIIALTASPSEEDRRECMRAGMDGFLSKPFTADELVEAIRAAQEDERIRLRDHPLYEFALSLDDTDGDFLCHDGNTIH
jgi:two-component system, sensor histidine kinase